MGVVVVGMGKKMYAQSNSEFTNLTRLMAHVVVIVTGLFLGVLQQTSRFRPCTGRLDPEYSALQYTICAEEENTRSFTPRFSTRMALETVPSFVSIPTVTRNPNS